MQNPRLTMMLRWSSAGLGSLLLLFVFSGGDLLTSPDGSQGFGTSTLGQRGAASAASGTLWAAPVGAEAAADRETTYIKGPLRIIRDPYSAFSAVAVNPRRNEIVATDENNFQILVYDRLDNTPPQAEMTEPKRIIAGSQTEIEFQCGLYIDPMSGDIYAVNNDTKDKLVIFGAESEGNTPPKRWLETPHGTFGIAVDEKNKELFLSVQHDSALVAYAKDAAEDDLPLRMIQGDKTRLADPHGIAIDTERNLLFVANYGSTHDTAPPESGQYKENWPLSRRYAVPGSGRFHPPAITVYSRTADGNVPPLRIIEGPNTMLNWPTGLAFHQERNELFVSNDMTNTILVFDGGANGDAAPKRILTGPKTRIDNPTGVYLDPENDELWVANFGGHSITVYETAAAGDTPPKRIIRSAFADRPSLMIGNPGALAYDTKRKEILVPN